MTAIEEKVRELQERVEAIMLVILKNVTASSEETKVAAACQEIEAELKDLHEYVLSVLTKKQQLTMIQYPVRNHFRRQSDPSPESAAHGRILKSEQG